MAGSDIKEAVKRILCRIDNAYERRSKSVLTQKPCLVAVSKTKPVEDIIEAYSVGQRDFGENYVQELIAKASNPRILHECKEIKWHFIGHLQTNKINKLVKCPGLYMVQTVDSKSLAEHLNNAWSKLAIPDKTPLRVLVQVKVSKEDAKSGIEPDEAVNLYQYIQEYLGNLNVQGVMTIGSVYHDQTPENADFHTLMKCHKNICKKFNLPPTDLQVSMGMSNDFEHAIEMGSTIVRVGSSIFGDRVKKIET